MPRAPGPQLIALAEVPPLVGVLGKPHLQHHGSESIAALLKQGRLAAQPWIAGFPGDNSEVIGL
jgi:hypothetical protein